MSQLHPRLRATVQINRQHFRGQTWHVIQDPANNQYFRLNEAAYRFVGLLDGKRPIGDAWKICNEQLGDSAPTQGEVIQLLGQLYTSNLLHAELPPDAEGLFRRYRKRITREIQGYLMNLLFIRIPVLDPDRFLDRWVGVFGKIFTWYGFMAWMVVVLAGLYCAVSNWGRLTSQAEEVFGQQTLANNLPLLYLGFILTKVFHEFAHAFSCKEFGRRSGTGGEVHVVGVMFLVFTPMPYVDASSSWAFRKKWHRAVVGAAGMYVEMAMAAIATMIWANTANPNVQAICYQVMFISSVSTLLFNGNPLLRYDAYYILSDLVEIPNLAQRAKQYLYYLVRRYAWGVRKARNPAHSRGEKIWFVIYGVSSTVYRVVICVGILLFVADRLFFVGAVLGIAAVVAWVFVPLGKFAHYLATSGELQRVRGRAIGTVAAAVVVLVVCVGVIPFSDWFPVEAVVEPQKYAVIFAGYDGFVTSVAPANARVQPNEELVTTENTPLVTELRRAQAAMGEMIARRGVAKENQEEHLVQAYDQAIAALTTEIKWLEIRKAALTVRSPIAGQWVCPQQEQMGGRFLSQGDTVGMVASTDELIVRAIAAQDIGPLIIEQEKLHPEVRNVRMRVRARPADQVNGQVTHIMEAGKEDLPSKALGLQAGGTIATVARDQKGLKAMERFFEIKITPTDGPGLKNLRIGQRVMVRFDLPPKPLAAQWWRSILQLVQKRFHLT